MAKTQTLYANNARTTLASSITNSASSILLTDASSFPSISSSTQRFYVTIDDGTNHEVVLVTGVSGNTLTGCSRGQDGTTGQAFASTAVVGLRMIAQNIRELARLDDRIGDLTDITSLTDPATMNGNSYLCGGTNAESSGLLTVVSGGFWTFPNYPHIVSATTIGSGATTGSLVHANANTDFPDTFPKAYLIEFTSGSFKGQCRYISSMSSSAINWSPVLGGTPGASDTYRLYRYNGGNVMAELITAEGNIASNTADIITNTSAISTINGTSLPLKANIASPTFTGDPKSTTPATNDNDTSIATTAFVNSFVLQHFTNASTGEVTFGGVLKVKWANVSVSGTGNSYTWSGLGIANNPFVNCFGVVATCDNSDGAQMNVTSSDATGFTIDNFADSGTDNAFIIALGN